MAIVLVVDDEYFIREVMVSMVEEWGHVVLSADSVESARLHLGAIGRIDGLITDIRLNAARHGGFELAREARKFRPNLPVLYVSGLPLTDETTALLVDRSQMLMKPYSLDQLQNAVEMLFSA